MKTQARILQGGARAGEPRPLHICDLTTLFIDHGGSGGGVNTYLEEKARHFTGLPGVTHSIVVPGARNSVDSLHGARIHRIKSPRLPWNPEHRVLLKNRRVQRVLKQLQPDVIEADCVSLLGRAARKALPQTPIVGVYHVHLPTFIARDATKGLGRLVSESVEKGAWGYMRRCMQPFQALVVTSPDMRRRLKDRFGWLPKAPIPLGVNTRLFRPEAAPRRPDSPPRIVYVGRLSPEKQMPVLFEAWRRIAQDPAHAGTDLARCELHLVGDGPLRQRLARSVDHDPRVVFHGPQPYGESVVELLGAADVFVNPSPNEAFGLAALEAAACGLPVIAADRGGPKDVITPEIGTLAEPGDVASFTAAIRTCLQSRGTAAAVRASETRRHTVEQLHSWRLCFARLLELYRRLQQAPTRSWQPLPEPAEILPAPPPPAPRAKASGGPILAKRGT